ncbi:hypothetical protein Q2941_22000 [Bradyrhizobium sp. UFLA05-153]
MSSPNLYRAVNLRADLDHPQRLSHYHPTKRSVTVVDAVLGNDASIVIAAYGSGKSLAAGIGALIVRNDARAREAVQPVLSRLKAVAPALHTKARARLNSRAKGLVVNLAGYVPDLVDAIASSSGAPRRIKDLDKLLSWIADELRVDHVAIIWDEFGRHLEGLAAEGRTRDLNQVQRLAEWISRAQNPAASLTVLLHQNLLAYAGRLNQTSRNEWRKVEGRFRQLRFVEDSKELYSLVASAAAQRRPRNTAASGSIAKAVSMVASQTGWFDGLRPGPELADLLKLAHPLSAGALQVLPQVVARIGQNERSIFSFLHAADMSAPVGVEEVYRYFSESMRADVGPGGAQRRWLETESARAKAENELERELLAATCLFQLGASGERRKLTKEALITAVASRGVPVDAVRSAMKALLGRKLLIYRQTNDDVSIWHGIDVDIPARVADECARRADQFNLLDFLNARHPAPVLRAPRHNTKFGMARYLSGSYVLPARLAEAIKEPDWQSWGSVLFVIADNPEGIAESERLAKTSPFAHRQVIVYPRKPLAVFEAALELASLEALRQDEAFVFQDPLVRQELDELLALARRQLASILHRLTSERGGDANWHHGGRRLDVTADCPASVAASDLLDVWYPDSPRINNDQLMRQRISRQMSTARVRILMRSMERLSQPRFGYLEQDGSVEASVYRTVLERTGLHRLSDGRWGFAAPNEIKDRGLRGAWSLVERFFTTPSAGPRPLSDIVSQLASPPIGLPLGVIPILVMAGYRAFAKVVSLRTEGVYVRDILGFESSKMFVEPDRHTIEVHDSSRETVLYLSELAYVLAHQRPSDDDEALRFAYDSFIQWQATLPDGARQSTRLSPDTQRFLREILQEQDPGCLFLSTLPALYSQNGGLDGVAQAVERIRNELDAVLEGYVGEAVRIIGSTFRVGAAEDAVSSLQNWVSCFDVDALVRRDDLRMTDRAILRTARDTTNGRYTPQSLARAVSSILLQRGVEQWQDSTAGQFAMLVRECRARIEDAALASELPDGRLAPIVKNRIVELERMLARMIHREARQVANFGART